jgi:hypothetical protein
MAHRGGRVSYESSCVGVFSSVSITRVAVHLSPTGGLCSHDGGPKGGLTDVRLCSSAGLEQVGSTATCGWLELSARDPAGRRLRVRLGSRSRLRRDLEGCLSLACSVGSQF